VGCYGDESASASACASARFGVVQLLAAVQWADPGWESMGHDVP